ncbi:MAG: hypothetical protein ACTSWX_06330 [Promethearchaeota archaeon]
MKIIEFDPIKSHFKMQKTFLPLIMLRSSDIFDLHMLLNTNVEESLFQIGKLMGDILYNSILKEFEKKKLNSQIKFFGELLFQLGYGNLTHKKSNQLYIIINTPILNQIYSPDISLQSISNFYLGLFRSFFKKYKIRISEQHSFDEERKIVLELKE